MLFLPYFALLSRKKERKMSMALICPVCRGSLACGCREDDCGNVSFPPFRCGKNHCFDVSAKGYVNLLRSGGGHGDSPEMLEARRRFLRKGYYIPLAETIIGVIRDNISCFNTFVDAGCGEGWYTERIDRAFGCSADIIAVDVSPKAAAMTAGLFPKKERMKRVFCVAASVNSLPLETGSADVLMSVFSPLAPEEFYRVVRPGGIIVRAVPTARHLWQLKSALYDEPYENDETPRDISGFETVCVRRIEYTVSLSDIEDIKALFSMTPYSHRTGSDDEKRLFSLDHLDTEAGFTVTAYRHLN